MGFEIILCITLILLCTGFSDSILRETEKSFEVVEDGYTDTLDLYTPGQVFGPYSIQDLKTHGTRRKRAAVRWLGLSWAAFQGIRARQFLLSGLKPVKKFKTVAYYEKRGDAFDMKQDFRRANPTGVHDFMLDGRKVGRIGVVGDRTISYNTRSLRLTIAKAKRNGDVQELMKTMGRTKIP